MAARIKRPAEVRAEQKAKRARMAFSQNNHVPAKGGNMTASLSFVSAALLDPSNSARGEPGQSDGPEAASSAAAGPSHVVSNIAKLDEEEDDVVIPEVKGDRAAKVGRVRTAALRDALSSRKVSETDFPDDWSLKTFASFQAPFKLEWARTIGASVCCNAACSFHLQEAPETSSPPHDLAIDTWAKSLLHYVHPAHSAVRDHLYAANNQRKSVQHRDSVHEWRDAFRSLYYSYRHKKCPYFYLKLPSSTMLWRTSVTSSTAEHDGDTDGAGKHRHVVFISRSTRALRQKLRDCDVHFTMPMDVDKKIEEGDKNEEKSSRDLLALGRIGTSRTSARAKSKEGGFDSFIQIEGHEAIGGLYEVVLEQAELALSNGWGATFRMLGGASVSRMASSQAFNRSGTLSADDSPLLLTRVPFLHGTLRCAKLSFCGSVQKGDIEEQRLEFKMDGPGSFLLPDTLVGMRSALAQMAEKPAVPFEASFTADKDSSRFCRDGEAEEVVRFAYNGGQYDVESRGGAAVLKETGHLEDQEGATERDVNLMGEDAGGVTND